jgi:hypothetical protein
VQDDNKIISFAGRYGRKYMAVFTGLAVAAIGVSLLTGSQAAGPFVAAEPEQGTISAPATQLNDATASTNAAIKFQAAAIVSCALPNYPNASCTGVPAGTVLTNVPAQRTSGTGWTWDATDKQIIVIANSAVLEGLNVTGCVYVSDNASNVVVRKSKITTTHCGVANDGANTLVEDVEIDCSNKGGATALGWQGYTARRVHAYHCDNTAWAEHNVTIEDSYLHDNINYDPVTDPHTDGIQMPGGASNITIRHNTVYGNYVDADDFGNSAITSPKVADGAPTNVLIQDNLLAGGGYTLYCAQNGPGNNYRVINNHFSMIYSPKVGGFGPTTDCEDEIKSGNVYHETGLPLPF